MPINKNIISSTIGENDGISQLFIQNNIVNIKDSYVYPKLFEIPLFSLNGATFDYYQQNIDGVSVNINNQKTLGYTYTANTSSFSAITQIIYDIYRVDFDTYDGVLSNIDVLGNVINDSGLTQSDISALTSIPLITLYETGITSSITTKNYDLPFTVKPINQFSQPLLLDKSQYFVDTRFEFIEERDKSLGGFQILNNNVPTDISYTALTSYSSTTTDSDYLLQTLSRDRIITGGTFQDLVVHGALFTYFIAPQKPNIDVLSDMPSVIGTLDTFSPIFSFNNVSDGDYYKLQVSYDITDSAFLNSVVFKIPKQEGIPDFIRTYSTPLSPDAEFIYRIGNTKEIVNIFGVKQNVTTWSRYEMALTATDGIYDISGVVYQDELYGSPVSGATVKFVVTYTTAEVELGVDAPFDNTITSGTTQPLGGGVGSEFSALTNTYGMFSVPDVKGGTLDVIVSHPLYETTTHSINITSATTSADFTIILRWGSSTRFEDVGNQLFI